MFRSARLKLTGWYLLIIMAVSISFSVSMYRMLTSEVERFSRMQRFRIEHGLQDYTPSDLDEQVSHLPQIKLTDDDLVDEAKGRIIFLFVTINSIILFVSGGLGYFLAGRTLDPIQEMVDEQNRFITDASHEMRTPLTALKSSMEVYLREKTPDIKEAKALINDGLEEVNKIQALSDNLLLLSQYEKPKQNLKFEKLSFAEIAKEAIKKVEPMRVQKKIDIESNIQDYEITANKYSLIDLMVILLDNAVKYSPEKSTIRINFQKKERYFQLSIKDEGIGIDEKDIPHIFDRFYRADKARSKTDSTGYGLGLSIAKKIADLHRAVITVESEDKKGTEFKIRFLS